MEHSRELTESHLREKGTRCSIRVKVSSTVLDKDSELFFHHRKDCIALELPDTLLFQQTYKDKVTDQDIYQIPK